jgi:uncharacterized protein (TIGR01244 family)
MTMKAMKRMILLPLSLFALNSAFAEERAPILDLPNVRQPQKTRIVSGSLTAADIGRLRAAGIKHLINLRTEQESQGLDEAFIAAGLGIDYHAIPIQGAQGLTNENARKLDVALTEAGDDLTLIHCASGNRVGALVAVREAWIRGRTTEEAIAEGKRWGLASLEPSVRQLLEQGAPSK